MLYKHDIISPAFVITHVRHHQTVEIQLFKCVKDYNAQCEESYEAVENDAPEIIFQRVPKDGRESCDYTHDADHQSSE